MRIAVFAALLILASGWVGRSLAFEVEVERRFDATAETAELRIITTTDLELFVPLIEAFQAAQPGVSVLYTVASSTELFSAIADEGSPYDVAISSAMDLQMKLVNDGYGRSHSSPATDTLPAWARWRDQLFAISQEPVVLIVSKKGLEGLTHPENRQQLIAMLRDSPERFRGRIGTYDLRVSGAGYLFATQDVRQSDTFWRLAEVMGSLEPRLYCCSSEMIGDLRSGKIDMAYNVVGSYAAAQLKEDLDGMILPLTDYTHIVLRSALIPISAPSPDLASDFIDFLVGQQGRALMRDRTSLDPINREALEEQQHLRPIRLGPGLLVYLDSLKRQNFMRDWTSAVIQP